MSLLAFVLVTVSAFGWSAFDLFRKVLVERVPPLPLLLALTLLQGAVFGVWALFEGAPPEAGYWQPALLSVALNIVANALLIVAVTVSPLSVTIPLLSLTPVFTALLAIPLLGEEPTSRQWAGILLVFAGAMVLNLDTSGGFAPGKLLRSLVHEPGSLLMVGVALFWSLALPFDKRALGSAGPGFHATVLALGTAAGTAVLCVAGSAWRRHRQHAEVDHRGRIGRLEAALDGDLGHLARLASPRPGGFLALAVAASTIGLGFQLLAYSYVLVGIVEAMKRGLGNVLAVLFGRIVFAEPVGRFKLAAVLAMGVGVALVMI